ncbi:MAG: S8 family peptidase, partial [Acidobacteria bacterium]|nr:S8 family peptidase [Acidobacteriota bacterium]
MNKKNICRLIIIVSILGGISLAGVRLYVNSQEKKYQFSQKENIRGFLNLNDLQPFTDLRAIKLTRKKSKKINLENKYDVLLTCSFDTLTPWPSKDRMPQNFNPGEIINIGMDPGLGLKELHSQGITGKDVKVAIIDFPFMPNHEDYRDKVVSFNLTNGKNIKTFRKPAMHGTGTASLLVGERCGVAPGAKLYFWGNPDPGEKDFTQDINGLQEILKFNSNKNLADGIRVVSLSFGAAKDFDKVGDFKEILVKLKDTGVTVVLVDEWIKGIGCPLYKDRNNPLNYRLQYFFQGYEKDMPSGSLYVPCDYRTT